MPEAVRQQDWPEGVEASAAALPLNTRVDAPHVGSETAESDPSVGEANLEEFLSVRGAESVAVLEGATQFVQQVRAQAAQLAEHLRRQQAALDHREAELNARNGALEAQVRQARMWHTEQQHQFGELRAAADRRQQELDVRAEEIAEAASACQTLRRQTEEELRRREAMLETRESVLAARLSEFASLKENSKAALQQTESHFARQEALLAEREMQLNETVAACRLRDQQHDRRAAELDERWQRLAAAERLLGEEQADLTRARETLQAERAAWHDELASARHKLHEDRQDLTRNGERRRKLLERRRDDLEARRTALKQLRQEVARTQRETLEMRLVTEELWARLCGTMAPAALTQSLGQLRLKLADQNRLAQYELTERTKELQAWEARLNEQQQKVTVERGSVQDWVTCRTAEIEQQAAVLVAREQELDRQEMEMRKLRTQYHDERRAYMQEIRRLLRQSRETERDAAREAQRMPTSPPAPKASLRRPARNRRTKKPPRVERPTCAAVWGC